MQLLDVRDRVEPAVGPQHVGVLGVELGGDDAGLVLAGLEVRVWEAEEEVGQLVTVEEVGEVLHGVGAQGGDVVVGAWAGRQGRRSGGRGVEGEGGRRA